MNLIQSKFLAVPLILTVLLPVQGMGKDLDLSSSTYLYLHQEDQTTGPDIDHAPLYEYLSLDIWEVGRPELSIHLYGWGRIELGDETNGESGDGHLSSAQVRYQSKDRTGRLRVGRMLLTEGTTLESLDGLHLRKAVGSSGVSLFGGVPDGGDGSQDLRGDTLAGGRAYYIFPGIMEIGLNYLREDGDFAGDEREEAGADLWFNPADSLSLTGHAIFNMSTSGLASDDLSLSFSLSPHLEITLGTEGYVYEDLFQAATNPAFHSTDMDPDDEVRIMRGGFNLDASGRLSLHGAMKNTDHKSTDPGDNRRTEIGLDLDSLFFLDRLGFRLAGQTGDLPENEYREARAYCMATFGPLRWSLDAMAIDYEERIAGEDRTVQLVGSAGWKLTERLDLSGNVRVTRSPVFDEDLAVILRARYDLGSGSGVN